MPGAVVAAVFDVVVFGQGWDHGGTAGDLADTVEYDFRAAVVEFDVSMNLNHAAFQPADVANIFQSGGEDYDRERASHLIFAEVEEVGSFCADLDPEDLSRDASGFSDVLICFVNGDAIGSGKE